MPTSITPLFNNPLQALLTSPQDSKPTAAISLWPLIFLGDAVYHFGNIFSISNQEIWHAVLHLVVSLAILFCAHAISREERQGSGKSPTSSRTMLIFLNFIHLAIDVWVFGTFELKALEHSQRVILLAKIAIEQLWRFFILDLICAGIFCKLFYLLLSCKLASLVLPLPLIDFLLRARFIYIAILVILSYGMTRLNKEPASPRLLRADSVGSYMELPLKTRGNSMKLQSMSTAQSLGNKMGSADSLGMNFTFSEKGGSSSNLPGVIAFKRANTHPITETSLDFEESTHPTLENVDNLKMKSVPMLPGSLDIIMENNNSHDQVAMTATLENQSSPMELALNTVSENMINQPRFPIPNTLTPIASKLVSSSSTKEESDWEHRIQARILNELPEGVVVIDYNGRIRYLNSYMRNTFNCDEKVSFAHLSKKLCEFKFVETSMQINDNNIKGISRDTGDDDDLNLKQSNDESNSNSSKDEFLAKVQKISSLEQLFNSYVNETEMWEANQNCVPTFQTRFYHNLVTDYVPMEVKANLASEAGDQKCLIILLRDTTGRDNKIFTLETEKIIYRNNLIASFSHELRTPLNANLAFLEQALDSSEINSSAKQTLIKPALSSGRLLSYLINDILDYSQLIVHSLRLKIKPYSLAQTVNTCLELLQGKIDQKNLTIKAYIDKDIPKIFYTDHARLKQILINLLSNAIKFTMDGCITVSLKKTNTGSVIVSVEDDGIGMEPEAQQKLKLKLSGERLKDRINDDSVGVGLGLFISNKLVQMLSPKKKQEDEGKEDGSDDENRNGIKFWSERNQGSHFYFEIENKVPCVKKEECEIKTKKRFCDVAEDCNLNDALNEYSTRPFKNTFKLKKGIEEEPTAKVLIVDDEVFNVIVIDNFCKSFRVPTEKAFNGKEAIAKLRDSTQDPKCPIRVVFMDVNMPIMDGYEATLAIHNMLKREEIEEVVIIGVTAYVSKDMIDKCYKYGMTEVLNKPLSKGMVTDVLKRYNII